MKCSVFIAASVDGFIAKPDDNIDWLHTSGNGKTLKDQDADLGFSNYLKNIDCLIMGRKCMDIISSMNLSDEQWPYGKLKIIVLSNTLKKAPKNLEKRVEMYSGDISNLIDSLDNQGYKHAYIDGGTTIQNFINLKLINEIILTRVPVLIGQGKPLFGALKKDIILSETATKVFDNDYVQIKYKVTY